jgi:hypothetical protein
MFRTVDRKTPYILPLSMDDWLPKDHPARFIVEVVSMGIRSLRSLGPLVASFYGYATRTLSSLRIEAATYGPVALMKHRLKTPEGRKLYDRLKATIEPAFGVNKQVMGFRRFPLRGLRAAKGE